MDRDQLLNDAETATRTALQGWQAQMWTSMPAIVKSVNLTAMTLTAQPAIKGVVTDDQGNDSYVNLPLLVDVPIVFPGGGGFVLTMPISVNDECLIVIASRCIDAWWQLGGTQVPMEDRMHDLSDAFAIVGPVSTPNAAKLVGVSTTGPQLRNLAGTTYVGLSPTGLIQIVNASGSLGIVLAALQTSLVTFMTALAALSGGAAPATQAMLQVPAAACEASLVTVLAQIEALLQ